jgi:hypothetical protein
LDLGGYVAGNHFIDVTPDPTLSPLNGTHYGVMDVAEMFGGVLILGGIAASYVSANHAQAEMNPCISKLHALFTNVLVGGCDLDLIEMLAFQCHVQVPPLPDSDSFRFTFVPVQPRSSSLRFHFAKLAPAS